MSQELGITEKTPDFMNPYRTERDDVSRISILQFKSGCLSNNAISPAGASHRRSVQEDPEGGREEEEKGGEEKRNQERPSHLPLPLGTIAPLLQQVWRAESKEIGARGQSSLGDPTC